MGELDEGQRAFVFKLVEKFAVIETKGRQWRINPDLLGLIEVKMQDYDPYDSIKKVVEDQFAAASYEERIVIQSFVMEFVVANFKNVHIPEVKDTDVKDSRGLIDYLIEEDRKSMV